MLKIKPPTESQEHLKVIQYLKLKPDIYAMTFHSPNEGKRSVVNGYRLKSMGMQAGFPDIGILVPKGFMSGLFIELKSIKGKVSDYQMSWIKGLNDKGYCARVCYGADAAIDLIDAYMKMPNPVDYELVKLSQDDICGRYYRVGWQSESFSIPVPFELFVMGGNPRFSVYEVR